MSFMVHMRAEEREMSEGRRSCGIAGELDTRIVEGIDREGIEGSNRGMMRSTTGAAVQARSSQWMSAPC